MSVSIADRLSASREVDVFPNQVGLRYSPRSRRALRDTLLQEAQKSVRFLVQEQADEMYGTQDGPSGAIDMAMASPIPPYPNCWMEWDMGPTEAAIFKLEPCRMAVRVHTSRVDVDFCAVRVGWRVERSDPGPDLDALVGRLGWDAVLGAAALHMGDVDDGPAWAALGLEHGGADCRGGRCTIDRLVNLACATHPDRMARGVAGVLAEAGVHFHACFHPLLGPAACERTVWDPTVYGNFYMGPLGQLVGPVDTESTVEREHSCDNRDGHDWLVSRFGETAFAMCLPAVYAISLLNCKNVGAADAPFDGKASRRWAVKARGRPLFHWKTLRVTPMQPRRPRDGGEPDPARAGTMPVYDVRRHIKDYRHGKGLFGQHKGLFLFEAHTAGNPAVGRVEKDYEVKSPPPPEGQ